MSAPGTLFGEGPGACPFVALELDRDHRSDAPDHRHRCYAEPTPAPRSIAHQQAYCLSPNFSACPVFQVWAARAAASPVPGAPADVAGKALGGVVDARTGTGVAPAAAGDAPADIPVWPANMGVAPADYGETRSSQELHAWPGPGGGFIPPPAPAKEGEPSVAPVPPFLSGRSAGRVAGAPQSRSDGLPVERIKREDLVPSWDVDGRHGAQTERRSRGNTINRVITALAVLAILSLGVAAVVLVPGLLAGPGGTPASTPGGPNPSVNITLSPSVAALPTAASLLPTPVATPVPVATGTPAPNASPQLYRIRPGDRLRDIARRFGVTVGELLAANPQIVDPDHIEVGEWIVIPPPSGSLPTATP